MIILLQLFLSFFVSIVDLLVSRLRPMVYLAPHSERPTTPAQPVFVDQVNQAIHLMTISAGAIRSLGGRFPVRESTVLREITDTNVSVMKSGKRICKKLYGVERKLAKRQEFGRQS